jgi:hypothetical protein
MLLLLTNITKPPQTIHLTAVSTVFQIVFESESSLYFLNGEIECYGYACPVLISKGSNRIKLKEAHFFFLVFQSVPKYRIR